jgi:hypothetical protein
MYSLGVIISHFAIGSSILSYNSLEGKSSGLEILISV